MRNLFSSLILLGIILFNQGCSFMNDKSTKAINLNDIDQTVKPGDDFNQYANGGWIANNPIPDDKSRFGSFDLLRDTNEIMIQQLIDGIVSEEHNSGSIEQKIADFVNSGMDTVQIEEQGISPLMDEFEKINAITTKQEIQSQIIHFHTTGVSSAFGTYAMADAKNSDLMIAVLYQSGLGLPDRDYYVVDNDKFNEIRAKYVLHLERMFGMLGDEADVAKNNAEIVFAFEKQLAEASMDRLSLRDPHKTYNPNDISSLSELAPNINWEQYFNEIGLIEPGTFSVGQPEFFKVFDQLLTEESVETWKAYFRWNLINSTANFLSKDFVAADFDFYGKTLRGTPENKERWKQVLDYANGYLGEAIGQAYVKAYFPFEAKERMLNLVGNLKIALGERIDALDWMGDDTKANAHEKLASMSVKIGYPDKWKDYSNLNITKEAYVINVMHSRKYNFNERIAKINKPVDKTEWHMPPQIVNAYYSPSQNEIVFPAGILQPPFFFLDADDAVNYGAIGVVIGHEMTHGFDDKGRLYDKDGNLNTWWTDEDSERFKAKTEVLVEQFNNFTVIDSLKANGKYTLGENIADLGGINIAYTAFTKTAQWDDQTQTIDGFSADQRFFLSYAHLWAQNIRDEEISHLTQNDVHSLGKWRVIGPLRNVPEFHKAFNVEETDYMYLAESERAEIW